MARPRLNVRFVQADGVEQSPDPNGPGVAFAGGNWNLYNAGFNPGGTGYPLLGILRAIYTWNVPAIVPGTGSINATVSQDVVVTGAAVGDPCFISPIGSCHFGLSFFGGCYSAGVVNVRAEFTGTTGAYTPGNVPLKIVDLVIN